MKKMRQCAVVLVFLSNGTEQHRVLANIGENTMTNWSGNLTMLVLSVGSQKRHRNSPVPENNRNGL
jgi:hypothetical protein